MLPTPSPCEPVQAPFHLLVVDDEPDLEPLMRQRLRRRVRAGEYALHFASDGVEALELLRTDQRIDLVVTDINMPRMDGLALLAALPDVDPDLRSVVVSAYGDMDNIRAAMNRGAFDFVTKPVDFDDLSLTIERARAHVERWREAAAARHRLSVLQSELAVASAMQHAILPPALPSGPEFDVDACMVPARSVAGDFYDALPLEHGRYGFTVADVSGKGVPAALFMMSSRTLLKGAAIGACAPERVLGEANALLHADNSNSMFVTVFYLVYDPPSGRFTYASGGHCPGLVVRASGVVEVLERPLGVVLGLSLDVVFASARGALDPGDTLVLYTDGVTDAASPDGVLFGLERLRALFLDAAPGEAAEATARVLEALRAFSSDAPQSDDITCLAVHRRAEPA